VRECVRGRLQCYKVNESNCIAYDTSRICCCLLGINPNSDMCLSARHRNWYPMEPIESGRSNLYWGPVQKMCPERTNANGAIRVQTLQLDSPFSCDCGSSPLRLSRPGVHPGKRNRGALFCPLPPADEPNSDGLTGRFSNPACESHSQHKSITSISRLRATRGFCRARRYFSAR
jgi:hypothetical protein